MAKSLKKGASGSGNIRKRSDGRWEARYTLGFDPETGKQAQRSVYGKTQKEVRQKLAQITTEVDAGTYCAPNKMTVGEWMDTYLETYAKRSIKASTLALYQSYVREHIKPCLGKIRIDALDTPTIQQFYNQRMDERGLVAKTIKNIHGILHKGLSQAVKLGLIRFNPSEACDLPRGVRKPLKPLEGEEISMFLDAIKGNRYETIFVVTMFTGLRKGEVLGLTWDCVDMNRGNLIINKQLQRRNGNPGQLLETKNSKVRVIKVAPTVLAILADQKNRQAEMAAEAGAGWNNPHGLVFSNALGSHLSTDSVYKEFKKIVTKLGFPNVRFHDLRHGYAVAALECGDDIKTVQENLGHATASFTLDVYGHVSQGMRDKSASRMESFIQSVSTP